MADEGKIYDSTVDYIVQSVDSAEKVFKSYDKKFFIQKIMLAINFVAFGAALDSGVFPNWVPILLGAQNIGGIILDASLNASALRAIIKYHRLFTRNELMNINKGSKNTDPAREYVVELIEEFEKKINDIKGPAAICLILSGILLGYASLALMGILPADDKLAKLPLLAAIFGEFGLFEIYKKSVYEQRVDELQITLDLDDVKRSRRK